MLKELLVENNLVPASDPLLFGFNSHGKPHLTAHSHIHFNISHCPKAIAVRCGTICYPLRLVAELLYE